MAAVRVDFLVQTDPGRVGGLVTDVLPDGLAEPVAGLMRRGAEAMTAALGDRQER